jgi:hypothetical protein
MYVDDGQVAPVWVEIARCRRHSGCWCCRRYQGCPRRTVR